MIREEVNQGASFRYDCIIPQKARKVKGFLKKREGVRLECPFFDVERSKKGLIDKSNAKALLTLAYQKSPCLPSGR